MVSTISLEGASENSPVKELGAMRSLVWKSVALRSQGFEARLEFEAGAESIRHFRLFESIVLDATSGF